MTTIFADRKLQRGSERFQLSPSEVECILEIYRPEHRYVAEANLEGLELTCALKPTVYPYTQHEIFPYITAPTATIYSCQLAYVLVGALALKSPGVSTRIGGGNWSEFLEQRDKAGLRFTTFRTRFNAEVENRGLIPAVISVERTRGFQRNTYCVMSFNIGEGISGEIRGVIIEQRK